MKTIIHVSDLSVPPDRVFEALTTLDGLAAWWTTKVAGDAGPAGQIDFTFAGDFNPKLVVTSFDAPSTLCWRCTAGVGQWRDNTFRFELQARDAGTRLRFRQDYASELSDDDFGSYNYQWGYYLESLRQYCETGAGKPFQASGSSPITPEDLVRRAIGDLYDRRYPHAIDRYWSPDYTDHSIPNGQGLDGLRKLADSLPSGFRHELIRLFADGGLVVAHGIYHGLGPAPVVAFDLWRVDDGKIAEHWNGQQPWAAETLSGHTMVDGPAQVTKPSQTASSRSLVEEFADLIMMGRDRSQIGRFFDGDRFIQHNPLIADGVSGLGEAIQSGVWAAVVERTHHVLAEGEFVFTHGEGILHGSPTVFCDLFRVQDGKLAEHWDVVCAKPVLNPGRLARRELDPDDVPGEVLAVDGCVDVGERADVAVVAVTGEHDLGVLAPSIVFGDRVAGRGQGRRVETGHPRRGCSAEPDLYDAISGDVVNQRHVGRYREAAERAAHADPAARH